MTRRRDQRVQDPLPRPVLWDAKAAGRLDTIAELHEASVHGAVKRVRPKMMTVAAAMMGLMPIMLSMGTGADVMKRVAYGNNVN